VNACWKLGRGGKAEVTVAVRTSCFIAPATKHGDRDLSVDGAPDLESGLIGVRPVEQILVSTKRAGLGSSREAARQGAHVDRSSGFARGPRRSVQASSRDDEPPVSTDG